MTAKKQAQTAAEVLAYELAVQLVVYGGGRLLGDRRPAPSSEEEDAAGRDAVKAFCAELRRDTWREGASDRAATLVEREASGILRRQERRKLSA